MGLTVEDALHVHSEDVIPTLLLREIVERPSPCNAGVVDENVEFAFPLLELFNESIAALLGLKLVGINVRLRVEVRVRPEDDIRSGWRQYTGFWGPLQPY